MKVKLKWKVTRHNHIPGVEAGWIVMNINWIINTNRPTVTRTDGCAVWKMHPAHPAHHAHPPCTLIARSLRSFVTPIIGHRSAIGIAKLAVLFRYVSQLMCPGVKQLFPLLLLFTERFAYLSSLAMISFCFVNCFGDDLSLRCFSLVQFAVLAVVEGELMVIFSGHYFYGFFVLTTWVFKNY